MDKTYKDIREDAKAFQDDNDCTVVAVSVVCGIPYAEAHALLAAAGRKRGKGFAVVKYHEVIRRLGFRIVQIRNSRRYHDGTAFTLPDRQLQSKTVRTVERELAENWGGCKILINVSAHVLAWNGKQIADWSAGKTKRILNAYLVYKGEMPQLGVTVPAPEQQALTKTGCKRSAVKARCADMGFPDWVEYRSVKAAYEAMGLDLRGHQAIRRDVKRHGWAMFYGHKKGEWYGHDVEMKLATFEGEPVKPIMTRV